jgi:hypothetical protein
MSQISWQDRAAAKVAETASMIPRHWRISEEDRDRAKKLRNLTGPFIESFLSESEASIIRLDSLALVEQIADRSLTSLEVTEAYCKTAAIAHQIVTSSSEKATGLLGARGSLTSSLTRTIVFTRSSSRKLSHVLLDWIDIMTSMANQLDHSTVFQSASKTSSMSRAWTRPWDTLDGSTRMKVIRIQRKSTMSKAKSLVSYF